MTDEPWRPLGVETDSEVAAYDALHDDVPDWLSSSYWAWVRDAMTIHRSYSDGSGRVLMLDTDLAEAMCETLQIVLPNLRSVRVDRDIGTRQLGTATTTLQQHPAPLQIADYRLAHGGHAAPDALDAVLKRGKSAWVVGTRSGRAGLVRRVPLGVQVVADSVMARAGRAGVRLAQQVYGVAPNPSEAYRLAILAVEDAAVPVVSPTNSRATLGTVLQQLHDQGDWQLPVEREHEKAPSREVIVSMVRLLWHGQHDRHGGQPSSPGNVSIEEATIAVTLAVLLVQWFDAGLVSRTG